MLVNVLMCRCKRGTTANGVKLFVAFTYGFMTDLIVGMCNIFSQMLCTSLHMYVDHTLLIVKSSFSSVHVEVQK